MPRHQASSNLHHHNTTKSHSKLAKFLTNPNQKHLNIADQAISYCLRIKQTAIKYSGEAFRAHIYYRNLEGEDITFYRASNIVFADDKETRQSSQGYLFILFGGLINQKATLQRSITRLTTEAELLSLSTAAIKIIQQ